MFESIFLGGIKMSGTVFFAGQASVTTSQTISLPETINPDTSAVFMQGLWGNSTGTGREIAYLSGLTANSVTFSKYVSGGRTDYFHFYVVDFGSAVSRKINLAIPSVNLSLLTQSFSDPLLLDIENPDRCLCVGRIWNNSGSNSSDAEVFTFQDLYIDENKELVMKRISTASSAISTEGFFEILEFKP